MSRLAETHILILPGIGRYTARVTKARSARTIVWATGAARTKRLGEERVFHIGGKWSKLPRFQTTHALLPSLLTYLWDDSSSVARAGRFV